MSLGTVIAIVIVSGLTLWLAHVQLKTVRQGRGLYWCMVGAAAVLLVLSLFPERGESPAAVIIHFIHGIIGGLIHE